MTINFGDSSTIASGSGRIIQVLQTTRTDLFTTTSSSYSDYISQAITPSSTSSKIFCSFSAFEGSDGGDGNSYSQYKLMRGSTHVYFGDARGQAGRVSAGRFGRQQNYTSDHIGIDFLDSPSTTSSVTYKIQVRSPRAGTFRVFLAGTARNDFFGGSSLPVSFTLM